MEVSFALKYPDSTSELLLPPRRLAAAWPPAQVFMLAWRHQSATMLLPAAASFWPPAQVFMPACRHQSAATLLPAAACFWPLAQVSCSLAGTNLQPHCSTRRCIFLACAVARAAASFWPHAQVFVPVCRDQSASFSPAL
jgi:hypothetical protein